MDYESLERAARTNIVEALERVLVFDSGVEGAPVRGAVSRGRVRDARLSDDRVRIVTLSQHRGDRARPRRHASTKRRQSRHNVLAHPHGAEGAPDKSRESYVSASRSTDPEPRAPCLFHFHRAKSTKSLHPLRALLRLRS